MPRFLAFAVTCFALGLLACSGSGSDHELRVGHEPAGGSSGSAGTSGFGSGPGGDGGIAGGSEALHVRVQDADEMTVELITLACAGDCADVQAVAHGGNPPYSFAWENGSTNPQRHVCLDTSSTLSVSATDTAIDADEFHYDAHTATAKLTATVLTCGDGGTRDTDAATVPSSCGEGATPIFQIMTKLPSTPTNTFVQMNGNLPGYTGQYGGLPLAIMAKVQRTIELGSCTKLLLAGDPDGTKDTGWDDSMIIEYRSTPGGAVEKRWYYGAAGSLTYTPQNQVLTSVVAPTVPGSSLDPPVPNPLPFGFAPLAIDVMAEVPANDGTFELTFYLLDAGNVGSSTEIWAIPR